MVRLKEGQRISLEEMREIVMFQWCTHYIDNPTMKVIVDPESFIHKNYNGGDIYVGSRMVLDEEGAKELTDKFEYSPKRRCFIYRGEVSLR